jgi:3-oxoacyl-[acyl-carrier protein] reductase
VEHVAPLVAFLASPAAEHINGQVFVVYSGMVALMAAPVVETRFDSTNAVWTPDELAATVGTYFADRDPARTFGATDLLSL